ncbi:LAMI_0H02916g1_1 [Lachancea mirantina]|uniref:LAMI_0H02916g1_1 n=1 Tax=Lachancea mirantina TaxID=1230905 RepID=A0A1G4KE72_9SACH|nr:LAMI_0H02916g1_1 [Lachancea mirantina]
MSIPSVDEIEFLSRPSGKAEGKHHIIVVGAGIIGVCTAFYLTRHPRFDPSTHHITLLESKRVAGGASGKAGGLLATWAFPQQIVPLSFQLHQDLSDEFDGENQWDYRRLTTVSLEADVQNVGHQTHPSTRKGYNLRVAPPKKKSRCDSTDSLESSVATGSEADDERENEFSEMTEQSSTEKELTDASSTDMKSEALQQEFNTEMEGSRKTTKLPVDLNWIKKELVRDWSSLGGTDSTAQVHPYKFTHFLLREAMNTGAVDLILGKVNEIKFDDVGCTSGVSYIPTTDDDDQEEQQPIEILASQQVVLAMGPWTSKILPDCPISGLRAHSITIKPSTGTVSPYAIFTELKVDKNKYFSPEMYARKDEVYVCGEGDTLVELPETSDAVEVVREKCDELYHYVSKLSSNLSEGHILKRQACYLPVLNVPTSSGPLIGETNLEGLYVASGHSCWGINNAPATGKIVSELLLDGEATSADISALDPGLYFDASVLE